MRGYATDAPFKPYGFDHGASPYVRTAHLCSYIKDDGTVAAYIGCDRAFVAKVRSELPRNEPVRFKANRNERYGEDKRSSSGMQQDAEAKADAEWGSARLNKMMWAVFDNHARRNGLTPYEAAVCLQNCKVRP